MPILRTIFSLIVVAAIMSLMVRLRLIQLENLHSSIALTLAIMALLRTYERPEPKRAEPGAARRIA